MRAAYCLFLALCFAVPLARAQQECPVPPPITPVPRSVNMFSDQQEVDLGDVLAESITQRLKIIDDDHLSSYLTTLGNRLVRHLPATTMNFRFYLVELPAVNAFSIAGGRVYVARKMVALTQNEDELAGVLSHELGHIVTHQTAIEMSRRFRENLGVEQVGDRNDISAQFHRLIESWALHASHEGSAHEQEQYVADQVALYAMARAGYAPHAYVDLWDRFQETHGKTGNWFTDLFGTTKPSERRLREMLKQFSSLPAGCADIRPSSNVEFDRWRSEVIAYSDTSRKESLPGLAFSEKLLLPLRPDIAHLRYSPDGKYLLAQDEAGIHVLSSDPLSQSFYIAAPDARDAFFTPDSKSIAFHNRSLRVEIWSIADQKRSAAYEVTLPHACLQSELSPDGEMIACLDEQFELELVEAASGKVVFRKEHFYHVGLLNVFYFDVAILRRAMGENPTFIRMRFSPDGRYFIAAFDDTLVLDLNTRREAWLPGSIRDLTHETFTFVGSDRILGINTNSPAKSHLLRFPSGEHLDDIPLGRGIQLRGVSHGDYVLVRPVQDYAAGAIDLKSKKITVAVKNPALDIYDGFVVHEREDGQLSLDRIDPKQHMAAYRLPEARLGPLYAASASPDLTWLAISGKTRGALWNIPNNIRSMHLRGFRGAWFGDDQMLYADMPKYEKTERQIAVFVPTTGAGSPGYQIGDARAEQRGHYLLVMKPRKKNPLLVVEDADVEVREVRNGSILWSRYFPHELPKFSFAPGEILLTWKVSQSGGQDELRHFPELKDRGKKEDYLCELVDLTKNSVLAKLIVKTHKASFLLESASAAGDWVIATASGNQILAYSLSSGDQKVSIFGMYPVLNADLLAVDGEPAELKIYALPSPQIQHRYVFPDPIAFKQFSADGKKLLVLTATQNIYILDLTAAN